MQNFLKPFNLKFIFSLAALQQMHHHKRIKITGTVIEKTTKQPLGMLGNFYQ
jgi:hypothetical protein